MMFTLSRRCTAWLAVGLGLLLSVTGAQAQVSAQLVGRAADENGVAITNLLLLAFQEANPGNPTTNTTTTDASGNFSLNVTAANVTSGLWTLQADTASAQAQALIGPTRQGIAVTNGLNVSNLLFVLRHATNQIFGTVTDTNGQGIVGLPLLFSVNISNQYYVEVTTTAGGAYAATVSAGQWDESVNCNALSQRGYACTGNARSVTVAGNNVETNFVFASLPPFEITNSPVLPSAKQSAFYETELSVVGGTPDYTWTSGSNSVFPAGLSIQGDPRPTATLQGVPQASGDFTFTVQVTDTFGRVATNDFTLHVTPADATWSGQVVDNLNNPQTNLTLRAVSFEGDEVFGVTDGNGNFTLPLNEDEWQIGFDAGELAGRHLFPATVTANVTNGVNVSGLLIVLPQAPSRIVATVKTERNELLEGLTVRVTSSVDGTNYAASGVTDADGETGLPVFAGTWTVLVDTNDLAGRGLRLIPAQTVVVTAINNYLVTFQTRPAVPTFFTPDLPSGLVGDSFSVQLDVFGGEPPYTWSLAGSVPPGLTLSTNGLLAGSLNVPGSYTFDVQVRDGSGQTYSHSYTVDVVAHRPFIIHQPTNTNTTAGATATFVVDAAGDAPLHYQWHFNGKGLPGKTDPALIVDNAQLTNVGSYYVAIVNPSGFLRSRPALLAVTSPPLVISQPTNVAVFPGTNATFRVGVLSEVTVKYQWRFNGTNIAGATASTYTVKGARTSKAGNYSVLVSNIYGATLSSNATLKVLGPVVIVQQPLSQSVRIGKDEVSFNVVLSTNTAQPVSYQWRFNGAKLEEEEDSELLLSDIDETMLGSYSVIVRNGGGAVTSKVAKLSFYECSYKLSSNFVRFPVDFDIESEDSLEQTVTLLTQEDCGWSVRNTNDWITFLSDEEGTGTNELELVAEPNDDPEPRLGVIEILDEDENVVQRLTVMQPAHNAPADIAGKTIYFEIEEGGGDGLAASGTYYLSLKHGFPAPYVIANLTGDTLPKEGTYIYFRDTFAFAQITAGDVTYDLSFNTALTGEYVASNTNADQQTGIFRIFDSPPDLDGDGIGDLVLQKPNRSLAAWFLNKTNVVAEDVIRDGTALPSGHTLVSVRDLNRDSHADLLMQDTTGRLRVWYLQGLNYVSSLLLQSGQTPGAAWRARAAGDLNHDGWEDIIFKNDDGRVMAWLMNSTNRQQSVLLNKSKKLAAGWNVLAVNDCDGDGENDLVLQQSNGQVGFWSLLGTNYLSSGVLAGGAVRPSGSRVVSLNDFNADGRRDLLLQTSGNSLPVWFLSNTNSLETGTVRRTGGLPAGWSVVGPK